MRLRYPGAIFQINRFPQPITLPEIGVSGLESSPALSSPPLSPDLQQQIGLHVRTEGDANVKFFGGLKKGLSAFDRVTTPEGKVVLLLFLILIFTIIFGIGYELISDAYDNYHANHLSAIEHLRIAQELCHESSGVFLCPEPNADQAISHLQKIPPNASEYSEAAKLLTSISSFREKEVASQERLKQERSAQIAKDEADRARLVSQSEDESRRQWLRNIGGEAHDKFTCGTSAENLAIISFDFGHYWWTDDGRCAEQQQKQKDYWQQLQQAQEERERQKQEEEQKKRDEDAEFDSYWPSTFRVDTDMDSFWLPNEERTCQTYPDDKGHVARCGLQYKRITS